MPASILTTSSSRGTSGNRGELGEVGVELEAEAEAGPEVGVGVDLEEGMEEVGVEVEEKLEGLYSEDGLEVAVADTFSSTIRILSQLSEFLANYLYI